MTYEIFRKHRDHTVIIDDMKSLTFATDKLSVSIWRNCHGLSYAINDTYGCGTSNYSKYRHLCTYQVALFTDDIENNDVMTVAGWKAVLDKTKIDPSEYVFNILKYGKGYFFRQTK